MAQIPTLLRWQWRASAAIRHCGEQPVALSTRVDDMSPGLNLMHLYGWEEGELPADWVAHFSQHLYGITTMSRFVSVMVDNGVTVPQVVAGVGVDHWERVAPDSSYVA